MAALPLVVGRSWLALMGGRDVGVLDLGKLTGALIRAGLGADSVGDAAIFAQQRLNRGADMSLALWAALRDVRRGRRAITQRDLLRWGASSDARGVGSYLLPDGSRVRYRELLPEDCKSLGDVSRECEPWVSAAVNELG